MANEIEEWRAIAGNPNYEVSNLGRVRSLPHWTVDSYGWYKRRRRFYKGRILKPSLNPKGYLCVGLPGGRRTHRIHRLVGEAFFGATKEQQIDHVDGNKLNNCLWNLRVCSKSQNNANSKKRKDSTSGFKGVSAKDGKFQAAIQFEGKGKYLGFFATKEEAARAYDLAAIRLHGAFALTNQKLGLLA